MNPTKLDHFKTLVEEIMGICKWQPTYFQLEQMYEELKNKDLDQKKVSQVIYRIYGPQIEVLILKGLNTARALTVLAKIQELQNSLKTGEDKP
ncbi:S-(hydroxymethyl)glutathione dehydrogenase [Cedecea sp. S5-13]|uniref:S-(hydroxymethyl)glutathione dehydrogenase n=1 Tax=Cedecea selenatireducens TaxID=3144416 RepID=UPI0035CD3B53